MKILYVTAFSPYGPQCGAQKRSTQILRALQKIGDTSIAMACWRDISGEELFMLSAQCRSLMNWKLIRTPLSNIKDRIQYEFFSTYLNTNACAVPMDARTKISKAVGEHDIVWIHTIQLANSFRQWHWSHSVIDIDDIQSELSSTYLKQSDSIVKKAKFMRRVWQWRRRERFIFERFSLATVCSENDKHYLGDDPRIHVIPNGFETPRVRNTAPAADRPRLGIIGNFQHPPNFDGLCWFLNEAWPKVRERLPDAELRIVGHAGDKPDLVRHPRVSALGYVDDPAAEIRSWSGMIVPIRIGGGTRVKTAEAFARGCPVIATSLGAYGYEVEHDREMLLADTPEAFADSCVRVLTDVALRDRLAAAAADYFDQHLSWEALVPRVHKAVQACLDRSRSRGPAQHRDESCLKSLGL